MSSTCSNISLGLLLICTTSLYSMENDIEQQSPVQQSTNQLHYVSALESFKDSWATCIPSACCTLGGIGLGILGEEFIRNGVHCLNNLPPEPYLRFGKTIQCTLETTVGGGLSCLGSIALLVIGGGFACAGLVEFYAALKTYIQYKMN